jgi:hypothetical protein
MHIAWWTDTLGTDATSRTDPLRANEAKAESQGQPPSSQVLPKCSDGVESRPRAKEQCEAQSGHDGEDHRQRTPPIGWDKNAE